jgi:hypothetical protein
LPTGCALNASWDALPAMICTVLDIADERGELAALNV